MHKIHKWFMIGLVLISGGMVAQTWDIPELDLSVTKKGRKIHLSDIASDYSYLNFKADTAFVLNEVLFYKNNGLTGILYNDYHELHEARFEAITESSSGLYLFQQNTNFFFGRVNTYPDEENPLIQKVGDDFQEASLLYHYPGKHWFDFRDYSRDVLNNEYYLVKKNGAYGVICPEVYPDNYIVEPGFEAIKLIPSSMGSNYLVMNDGKWGAWENDRLDVEVKYDSLELMESEYQNNYYFVWLDGRKDLLISRVFIGGDKFEEVLAFEEDYDEIRPIHTDGSGIICLLRNGEKWGAGSYITGDGIGRKMIAELMYDDIKFLKGSSLNSCYVAWKDAKAVFTSTTNEWGENMYQADEVLKYSHVDSEGLYVFNYDLQDNYTYEVTQKEIHLSENDYLNIGLRISGF